VGYRPVFGGKEGVHHTLTLDCYDKYLNMYAYDAKGKVIHEEQVSFGPRGNVSETDGCSVLCT
jgi:hypothetical protein